MADVKQKKRKIADGANFEKSEAELLAAAEAKADGKETKKKNEKADENRGAGHGALGQLVKSAAGKAPPPPDDLYSKRVKSNSSVVWRVFRVSHKVRDFAYCDLCKRGVSIVGGGTSNCLEHLRDHHGEKLQELEAAKRGKTQQPKIQLQLTERQKQRIDKALVLMIAMDAQPFNTVNRQGFMSFVRALNPLYQLPSDKKLRQETMDLAQKVSAEVKLQIEKTQFGSCTSDGWRAKDLTHYISLTYHFLVEWEPHQLTLRCAPFYGKHDHKTIGNFYRTNLTELKMMDKVLSLCTDGAGDYTKAVREVLKKPNPVCCAHSLNNDVRPHGIDVVPEVKAAVGSFQAMAVHAKRHDKLMGALVEWQQENGVEAKDIKKLVTDVPHRWNSVLDLLSRAVDMEDCVRSVFDVNDKDRALLPNDAEWAIARDLVKFLKPFKTATETFSATQSPTASCAFPIFSRLLVILKKQMQAYDADQPMWRLANSMHVNLAKEVAALDDFIKRASFFDPRFLPFWKKELDENERTRLRGQLDTEFARWAAIAEKEKEKEKEKAKEKEQKKDAMDLDSDPGHGSTRSGNVKDSDFDLFPAEWSLEEAKAEPTIRNEITQYYENTTALGAKANPLHAWRDGLAAKYPVLAKMAARYLSVVVGSVASERLFSAAGDIINSLRTRLAGNRAEVLIYLQQNLPALRKLNVEV